MEFLEFEDKRVCLSLEESVQGQDGGGVKGGKIYPVSPTILWSKEILECKRPLHFSYVCMGGGGE